MRYHLMPDRMAIIKKTKITNTGEHVEKREPWCSVGGEVNWYSHYGEQYGDSSKDKDRTPIQSSYSTSEYLSEEYENTNSKRYMHPSYGNNLSIHWWINE